MRCSSSIAVGLVVVACGGRTVGTSGDGTAAVTEAGHDTGVDASAEGAVEGGSVDATSSMTSTGTTDDEDTTAGGNGSDDAPSTCNEGLTLCAGTCVSLWSHPAHCGECHHKCLGAQTTDECIQYECQPGAWPCITPGLGVQTCEEACGLVGETCVAEAAKCSGGVAVWLSAGPNDNYLEDDIEACMNLVGPNTGLPVACDEPIPWDFTTSGRIVVGVACCCTQP